MVAVETASEGLTGGGVDNELWAGLEKSTSHSLLTGGLIVDSTQCDANKGPYNRPSESKSNLGMRWSKPSLTRHLAAPFIVSESLKG